MADANEPTGTEPEAPEPAPAGVSDPNPTAASKGLSLANLTHGLKMVALLLFLLPWVTVSCAEQTLVSLSGVDLATGSVTVTNPMTGESASPPGGGEPDMPVLIGAILIIAALLIGFVMRRRIGGLISMACLAGAAALISYSVLYQIPAKAREDATAESAQGISSAQLAELIRVDVAIGFWLTLLAIIGAIALTFLAQRQPPPGSP